MIAWMRRRRWYYMFSSILVGLSLIGLAMGGLKPALEFTGGAQLVVRSEGDASLVQEKARTVASEFQIELQAVTPLPNNEFDLSIPALNNDQKAQYLAKLQEALPQTKVEEVSFQTVGPTIGRELLNKTGIAVGFAVVAILSYLWFQFRDWRFGFAGVLAMLHDTLIVIGVFAWLGLLFGVKVDVLFVTAVLTILSFSVHDTIVVFDRVRELRRTSRATIPLEELADTAINQTLTRSLNNSITILIMLAALLLLGGESLRMFTLALFAGTLIGTYSSTFNALPVYVDLVKWENRK